jgi:hypothetical protein
MKFFVFEVEFRWRVEDFFYFLFFGVENYGSKYAFFLVGQV